MTGETTDAKGGSEGFGEGFGDPIFQTKLDNFTIAIQKHLESRDLKSLEGLVQNKDNRDLWAHGVMQIFDVLGPFLRGFGDDGSEILQPPKLSSTLRSIIRHLCEVASAKEALLAIMGGLDAFKEDGVAFSHLVDPLARVLIRLNSGNANRRKKTFVLALNGAYGHIKKLSLPEVNNLEDISELKLIDQDTCTTRAVASTSSMVEFLTQLSPELKTKWQSLHLTKSNETRPTCLQNPLTCEDLEVQAFVKQILALFDVPFSRCHLPVPPGNDKDDDSSNPSTDLLRKLGIREGSGQRAAAAPSDTSTHLRNLLNVLVDFCPDFIKLLTFLRAEVIRVEKAKKAKDAENEEEDRGEDPTDDIEDQTVDLSSIAGGSLIHALFSEGLLRQEYPSAPSSSSPDLHLPSVYSRRHLLFTAAPFLPSLLLSVEELLNLKGVQSLEALINLVSDSELDKLTLEDLYFRRVLSAVTEHLLVKCPSKYIRSKGVRWVKNLAPKFDPVARFFFIRGLFFSSHHAGFKGYVLTYLLKPEMEAALKERDISSSKKGEENDISRLFIGSNMKSFYARIFCLKDGPETDLMQQQDTIMAALNLLRYLLLRDPISKNHSGIWDMKESLDKNFLEPFRKGIDLSKAHYELELKQIKSGERDTKRPEISMEVEGESSSDQNMAPEQDVDCLKSAIANFDMMNSVLVIVDDLLQRSQKEISNNR